MVAAGYEIIGRVKGALLRMFEHRHGAVVLGRRGLAGMHKRLADEVARDGVVGNEEMGILIGVLHGKEGDAVTTVAKTEAHAVDGAVIAEFIVEGERFHGRRRGVAGT